MGDYNGTKSFLYFNNYSKKINGSYMGIDSFDRIGKI